MKRIVIIAAILSLILLGFGATVQADPFLVCDPMSDENVTHFEIELNGNIVQADKYSTNSTHFQIHYDIGNLDPGEYQARARSANDEWNATSEWTDYVEWTVPSDQDMPGCINFRKASE